MSDNRPKVQDSFLELLRQNKTPTTIFLVNGVKLQGIISCYGQSSVLLRRDSYVQLVYKHAISTVMPNVPMTLEEGSVTVVE
ncbi:MAG: RNA chaperone Hfq [Bdellovibrionales bacterium]